MCGIKRVVLLKRSASKSRGFPPGIFVLQGGRFNVRELSVFIDESGDLGEMSRYYLVSFVFHDQANDINGCVAKYEASLRERDLRIVPMHVGPLINGNDDYRDLDKTTRARMLSAFRVFTQNLPFGYRCIAYRKSELGKNVDRFPQRMERDVTSIINTNLPYLQTFDSVKIYYDNGQSQVTAIVHNAFEKTLSKIALVYRNANPAQFHLLQVADYICTLELTEIKYQHHEETATDKIFFGTHTTFRKNFLRRLRKHLI